MDLVVASYAAVKALPVDERFALAKQIRTAATSIPANIAEGHGRLHTGDYLRHVSIANGSLMELETLLLLARRLDYLSEDVVATLLSRTSTVGRMLAGLRARLREKHRSRQ